MNTETAHADEVFCRHVAGMLVVAFQRCWTFQTLLAAIPCAVDCLEDAAALHARCPFMPPDYWRYCGRGSRVDVRRFVAASYPKLFAFMSANAGKPDRLLSVVPQIAKLTAKAGNFGVGMLADEDRKAGKKVRHDAKRVEVANKAARRQQLSTQRGAWNVCKA